jgi:Tfp pilus assembly protein PilF
MKSVFLLAVFLSLGFSTAPAQEPRAPEDQVHIRPKNMPEEKQPPKEQPPEKPGESSSKDSQINLEGPSKSSGGSDVTEIRQYDPHKAAKDIEVGQFYLKQKNYRAALDRFNEALLYKPNDAEATFYLAVTQDKLQMYDLAYKGYRAYLTLLPEGPLAKQAQEAVARISPHVQPAKPTEEQSAETQKMMEEGEAYLTKNDFEAAHTSFVKVLQIVPDDPVANFRVAESLQGLQRLDEARIFYRKCLALQPNGKLAAEAKRQITEINYTLGK